MRRFNFKSGEKPFKDFFKQGRDMSRFVFKKKIVIVLQRASGCGVTR